jgi:hypothetical protein
MVAKRTTLYLGPVHETNMEGPFHFKYGGSILILWLSHPKKMEAPFLQGSIA